MVLKNRAYDALKFVALVLLPGFSAAYFSLSQMWGLPNAEKVVGTATVIDTLLGLVLKASTRQFVKTVQDEAEAAIDGNLLVHTDDGEKYLSLAINGSVERLLSKPHVKLTVVEQTPEAPPAE